MDVPVRYLSVKFTFCPVKECVASGN